MKAALDISRIGQIAIPIGDLKRAEAFYRDVLGLKHLFTVEPAALSFFDCGGVRLMLDGNLRKDGKPAQSSILYLLVPELEQSFQHLQQGGAKVVSPPHLIAKMPDHHLWMGFFEDSEGNTLALMAELKSQPAV
jgi:methylmalonyl-CoA/ethylmalonyl-CoA epimerase